MGPVSLRPTPGAGWAPRGLPERQRADYNRRHGTRYVFGAYDVHADRLRVRLRPRRRGSDMLAFMAQIRARYPARQRIYWIQDNLSANWTPALARVRRRPQHRARRDPNLCQLPEPRGVSLLRDHPVRRRQRRLPQLGELRVRAGPPRHLPQRRSPRPPPRRSRSPTPHRRLMTFRVQQSLKAHS